MPDGDKSDLADDIDMSGREAVESQGLCMVDFLHKPPSHSIVLKGGKYVYSTTSTI
jgi:hypothetical protein